MKYCPLCRTELVTRLHADMDRLLCPAENCNFVYWNNPTPVVAAVVEHEGRIVLANNMLWPTHVYSIITGFLEKGESPQEGSVREVNEELGLTTEHIEPIAVYPFYRMNQLILGYYVRATGNIRLNEELRSCKHVEKAALYSWDSATGFILRDWLHTQGFKPAEKSLFGQSVKKRQRGELYQRIDAIVSQIPAGRVATYGQVAKLVGACGARQVGYAMSSLSVDSDVPWQRVINSQGYISRRDASEGHTLQRIILEEEGIVFNDSGRISLELFRWPGPAIEH